MENKNEFPNEPANVNADEVQTEIESIATTNTTPEIGESEIVADNSVTHKDTPTIPQEVYDKLPTLLKRGVDVFDLGRERDVFLTGALGVLSGTITNISGSYDGYEIYPNLNTLVIAPPASGKSRMKFAETLVQPLHRSLLRKYDVEVKNFKAKNKSNQSGNIENPTLQTLFIAGNSSSASVIKQMKANEGKGIIFETEADTLGNAFKQDWGAFFSELVRCTFQQETIRYERSTDKVHIEIEKPKLAIVLSGTANQVKPIISSIHNGLFSRFLYYIYKGDAKLKKIGKDVNGVNLTLHFEKLATELSSFLQGREKDIYNFEFTEKQFEKSHEFLKPILSEAKVFLGEDISSVVFRAGLIHFKICIILSVLREFDKGNSNDKKIICQDEDFEIGLKLMEVFLPHSFEVFQSMQKPASREEYSQKEQFLAALPNGKFERKIIQALTIELKKSERTLDTWLKEFVENGLIKQIGHGLYEKGTK